MPVNKLKPRPGLTISAYFSRRDIGSGLREFIVLSTRNKKRVTLFYPPLLKSFKISREEWDNLIVVQESFPCREAYAARIEERMDQYTRLHLQYRADRANKAIDLLRAERSPCLE